MAAKPDAYSIITDRIVEALEQGIVPWSKPWKTIAGQGPTNLSSGKAYRGINTMLLSLEEMAQGYSTPYWVTFRQARELAVRDARKAGREIVEETSSKGKTNHYEIIDGERVWFAGGVRKGEKSTPVTLWKPVKKTVEGENGEDEKRAYLLLRTYAVFNLDQCDGIEGPELEELPAFNPIERAEELVEGFTMRPEIKHSSQDRAYYSPALDYIHMPIRESFVGPAEYYATLFHELVHSTGHASRLNRKGSEVSTSWGDEVYAREELVAEIGAAFLCGDAEIEPRIPQNAAYIASWLKALKNDRKLVVIAAAQAQKAADYIVGREAPQKEGEAS